MRAFIAIAALAVLSALTHGRRRRNPWEVYHYGDQGPMYTGRTFPSARTAKKFAKRETKYMREMADAYEKSGYGNYDHFRRGEYIVAKALPKRMKRGSGHELHEEGDGDY